MRASGSRRRACRTGSRSACSDYRDETGRYDGIASIEMFEAVGEQYWPAYFNALRERLKPGGQAVLQIITVQDRRWEVYRRGVDFIQKYIFPGGMLPRTQGAARRDRARRAGRRAIRSSSAKATAARCAAGTRRFNARWERIAEMGFDDRFPADVEFLPYVLRGDLPQRKLRRDADHRDAARLTGLAPGAARRGQSRMPTAAKFVAAMVFGLVTWFATQLVIPYVPDGMRLAWFTEISTFFGVLMGWIVMGSRARARGRLPVWASG